MKMAYVVINSPVSIRGETSVQVANIDGIVYRVYDFVHDANTTATIVNDSTQTTIACASARELVKDGIMAGYAHNPRSIVCQEFVNKQTVALKAFVGMIGVSAILLALGSD